MARAEHEEPDWDEIVELMREARSKSRGYASYWEWAPDRSLAEVGVGKALADFLAHTEGRSWAAIAAVPDDPPDVLLAATSGERIGVEVTELVDPAAIQRHRHRKKIDADILYDWADWTIEQITQSIVQAVERKDRKLAGRAERYDEIYVAVATDEPMITLDLAQNALRNARPSVSSIHRAFLLLSYQPALDTNLYPHGIPVLPVQLHKV